jgi:hypothetical protein
MERVLYPPYSPDLTHCDFYLFGYVKESLTRKEIAHQEELLEAINSILENIEKMILEQVFLV